MIWSWVLYPQNTIFILLTFFATNHWKNTKLSIYETCLLLFSSNNIFHHHPINIFIRSIFIKLNATPDSCKQICSKNIICTVEMVGCFSFVLLKCLEMQCNIRNMYQVTCYRSSKNLKFSLKCRSLHDFFSLEKKNKSVK